MLQELRLGPKLAAVEFGAKLKREVFVVYVHGPYGCGKTTLMTTVQAQLQQPVNEIDTGNFLLPDSITFNFIVDFKFLVLFMFLPNLI